MLTVEGKEEIDEIKNRVLADIRTKRAAKTGEPQKEEGPKKGTSVQTTGVSDEEKNAFNALKNNSALGGVEDNKIATGLQAAIRREGEKENLDEESVKKGEDELIKRNPQLYIETAREALKARIKDNGIEVDKLDEDTKKLINGEITDANEAKRIKNQAVKKIGESGAQNKWSFLFSKAQSIIQGAKKNLTEEVKKQIKDIKKQLNGIKGATNSYLASLYQKEKSSFEKLEKDLETVSTPEKKTEEPKSGFFRPEIIVPISLVAVVVAGVTAVLLIRKRRQKQAKIKKEVVEEIVE